MQLQRIRVLNLNSIDFFLQSCFWYCSGTVVMAPDSELCSAFLFGLKLLCMRVLSPLGGLCISSEIETGCEDVLW